MFIKFEPTFHFIGKRKCSKSLCGGMHGYSEQAALDFFKHILILAQILNYYLPTVAFANARKIFKCTLNISKSL